MSKQIRVDDRTFQYLKALQSVHDRPISECARDMCDVFQALVRRIEEDNRLVIQHPDEPRPRELCVPFLEDSARALASGRTRSVPQEPPVTADRTTPGDARVS